MPRLHSTRPTEREALINSRRNNMSSNAYMIYPNSPRHYSFTRLKFAIWRHGRYPLLFVSIAILAYYVWHQNKHQYGKTRGEKYFPGISSYPTQKTYAQEWKVLKKTEEEEEESGEKTSTPVASATSGKLTDTGTGAASDSEGKEAEQEKVEKDRAEQGKMEQEEAERQKSEQEKAEQEEAERKKAELEKAEHEEAEKQKAEQEKAAHLEDLDKTAREGGKEEEEEEKEEVEVAAEVTEKATEARHIRVDEHEEEEEEEEGVKKQGGEAGQQMTTEQAVAGVQKVAEEEEKYKQQPEEVASTAAAVEPPREEIRTEQAEQVEGKQQQTEEKSPETETKEEEVQPQPIQAPKEEPIESLQKPQPTEAPGVITEKEQKQGFARIEEKPDLGTEKVSQPETAGRGVQQTELNRQLYPGKPETDEVSQVKRGKSESPSKQEMQELASKLTPSSLATGETGNWAVKKTEETELTKVETVVQPSDQQPALFKSESKVEGSGKPDQQQETISGSSKFTDLQQPTGGEAARTGRQPVQQVAQNAAVIPPNVPKEQESQTNVVEAASDLSSQRQSPTDTRQPIQPPEKLLETREQPAGQSSVLETPIQRQSYGAQEVPTSRDGETKVQQTGHQDANTATLNKMLEKASAPDSRANEEFQGRNKPSENGNQQGQIPPPNAAGDVYPNSADQGPQQLIKPKTYGETNDRGRSDAQDAASKIETETGSEPVLVQEPARNLEVKNADETVVQAQPVQSQQQTISNVGDEKNQKKSEQTDTRSNEPALKLGQMTNGNVAAQAQPPESQQPMVNNNDGSGMQSRNELVKPMAAASSNAASGNQLSDKVPESGQVVEGGTNDVPKPVDKENVEPVQQVGQGSNQHAKEVASLAANELQHQDVAVEKKPAPELFPSPNEQSNGNFQEKTVDAPQAPREQQPPPVQNYVPAH